jgi:hypothetical protein
MGQRHFGFAELRHYCFALTPVHLENIGKTPARIKASFVRHVFADNVDPNVLPHVPKLPEVPDYSPDKGGEIVPEDRVLMPKQTFDFLITLDKVFLADEIPKWRVADTLLCVYGFIRYESLGKVRETRFCYTFFFNRPMGNCSTNRQASHSFLPPTL